jgi:chitinase
VSGLNENVDFINLKTYSYHVPSRDPTVAPVADHHSPLRKRHFEMENENLNAEYSVTYWTNLGLLASKINLGIPLFGLSWTLGRSQSSSNSFVPPISAVGVGPPGDIMGVNNTMSFYEICSAVRNNGWKVFSDPTGKIGPYAVSPTDPKTWVGYDDPAMAIVKSQFILSEGLGGAFLSDISYDDFRDTCGLGVNPITTAIYNTLNGINTTCECICYDN